MSITSKIVLSALLVGITLPAFAQGSAVAAPKAPVTSHTAAIHKVSSPIEAPKAGAAVSTTPSTGVAASTKPATPAKGEVGKTDTTLTGAVKPSVNTGIVKPVAPLPAVKTN